MSDIVDRLRATGWQLSIEAADDIERLRAIVGRLPTTADGIAVPCGGDVYLIDGTLAIAEAPEQNCCVGPTPSGLGTQIVGIQHCYSTREAAEAARANAGAELGAGGTGAVGNSP